MKWFSKYWVPMSLGIILIAGIAVPLLFLPKNKPPIESLPTLMPTLLGFSSTMVIAFLTWMYVSEMKRQFNANTPIFYYVPGIVRTRVSDLVPAVGEKRQFIQISCNLSVTNMSRTTPNSLLFDEVDLNFAAAEIVDVSMQDGDGGRMTKLRIDGGETESILIDIRAIAKDKEPIPGTMEVKVTFINPFLKKSDHVVCKAVFNNGLSQVV